MEERSSPLGRNLTVAKRKPEKYSGLNGIQPMTSAMPVQCSTNWAIKPTSSSQLGAGQMMIGSITSRFSGKWARAHPLPRRKAWGEGAAEIEPKYSKNVSESMRVVQGYFRDAWLAVFIFRESWIW